MLEGILKGLLQWLYGLFLELISYCADSLLKVMSTDLTFFETSVPIVITLYKVFVAIGWGLLIGNLAFQSMKAMFAGFGFENAEGEAIEDEDLLLDDPMGGDDDFFGDDE